MSINRGTSDYAYHIKYVSRPRAWCCSVKIADPRKAVCFGVIPKVWIIFYSSAVISALLQHLPSPFSLFFLFFCSPRTSAVQILAEFRRKFVYSSWMTHFLTPVLSNIGTYMGVQIQTYLLSKLSLYNLMGV